MHFISVSEVPAFASFKWLSVTAVSLETADNYSCLQWLSPPCRQPATRSRTLRLSRQLTRPRNRDVMLNADLKTLHLPIVVPALRAMCMIFDAVGVLPIKQLRK